MLLAMNKIYDLNFMKKMYTVFHWVFLIYLIALFYKLCKPVLMIIKIDIAKCVGLYVIYIRPRLNEY